MQANSRRIVRTTLAAAGLTAFSFLAARTHAWSGVASPAPATSRVTPAGDPGNTVPSLSLASAQSLEDKLRALSTPVPPTLHALKPITITENEANSYLKYRGGTFLPPAVHDPELHITAQRVSGDADVDFGALNGSGGAKAAQPNDWTARALTGLFSGKQRVAATGRLETANGEGKVTIESVSIGSITVPPVLVDWLLANYVAKRYNIDLSKPFALPDHVNHIELGDGRALFVRSPNR